MGAAYGTAKSGIGIAGVGTFRPDLIMKVGRICLGFFGAEADVGSTVTNSRGYGWDYRSLLTCDIRSDCWRSGAATWTKLQPLQVR